MRLYISKCGNNLHTKPLDTEYIHEYICVNPNYSSAKIANSDVKLLMDSGAFQDTEKQKRVTFQQALDRQLKFEKKLGLISERIVAYDSMNDAQETLSANQFLASQRENLLSRQLVLVIQGLTTREYIQCLYETIKIATPQDCIGFGGVAYAAKDGEQKTRLFDAFKIGLPIALNSGIKNIHIFGVGTFDLLKRVREITEIFNDLGFDKNKYNISCDTSSFERNSTYGKIIDLEQEKWIKVFSKSQENVDYHACDLARDNMKKAVQIISKI